MKVDDIVKYRGPQLVPFSTDEADLAFLRARLRDAGYGWEAVTERFATPWPAFGEVPGYVWRCEHADDALSHLALLFLLCQPVARERIDAALGADGVQRLLERGVLKHEDDRLLAQVDLYPCQGAFVFTDHNVGRMRFSKHVYEPGADSYTCARTTPRRRVARALDLCTGGGLHAMLAAAHADRVVGVDVNPRALAFAEVNAAVNGVRTRVRFAEGDLYQALPADEPPFDLIVTNPPWIATPDTSMQLYRWGGETGEVLTRQIVEGLPRWLSPHGRLAMFAIHPLMRDSRYLDRLRAWLGGGGGWGITLITFATMSLESFIGSHMAGKWDWAEHVAEFGRWMDMYARHGIDRMGTGMVYVTRLPEGHPGWAVERLMPLPLTDLCGPVERWLDTLEAVHAPDGATDALRLSPEVAHVGVDPRDGEARVTFRAGWGPPERLDRAASDALQRFLDGPAAVAPAILRDLAVRGILASP